MPNLTQKTFDEAMEFRRLLEAIMKAKTHEERLYAYCRFTDHKLVEKTLGITLQSTTRANVSKRVICEKCNCATTNLKEHQKTTKCLEIWETKLITHRAKTTDVSKHELIVNRVELSKEERREQTHEDREERIEEVFKKPKKTKRKRRLVVVD